MDIPKHFKENIKKREKKEKAEKLKEARENNRGQALLKRHVEEEGKKLDAKIRFCRKIFRFRKEFLEMQEGKKLFKRKDSNLWVFIGNWGHEMHDKNDGAAWGRLYLTENGMEYWYGWKWMPNRTLNFKDPEQMARCLSFDYLKEVLDEIGSKKIFKNILKLNSY